MAVDIREMFSTIQTINFEGFTPTEKPITRIVVAGVIKNPYAGAYSENLDELIEAGYELGEILTKKACELLGGGEKVENYCKGALVGINGEKEHGGACLHPKLGKSMRDTIGVPCSALISCNKKVCNPGDPIDLPLMFRDYSPIRSHYDTIDNFAVPGHPKPDEIVVLVGVTDGGRPHPRLGGKTMADYLAAKGQLRDGLK